MSKKYGLQFQGSKKKRRKAEYEERQKEKEKLLNDYPEEFYKIAEKMGISLNNKKA